MNAADDEEWGTIAVSDQGMGIPTAELDRVFEQFYRVEDPMTMTTGVADSVSIFHGNWLVPWVATYRYSRRWERAVLSC